MIFVLHNFSPFIMRLIFFSLQFSFFQINQLPNKHFTTETKMHTTKTNTITLRAS